jgi:hypothetical protein
MIHRVSVLDRFFGTKENMKGGEANIKMGPQEIGCDGAD